MSAHGFYLDPAYPLAQAPVRHHDGDLGHDLFAAVDTFVPYMRPVLIPTGVIFAFPPGVGGIVTDRSSTFLRRGLLLHHGKIDNGYREPVGIAAASMSFPDHHQGERGQWVRAGERIAQIVMVDLHPWAPQPLAERPPSARGGWGSTGAAEVTR